MSKKKKLSRPYDLDFRDTAKIVRNSFRFYYEQKFFNIWMNKFSFPELNYQQSNYIMRKFWAIGTIACSSIRSANPTLAGLIDDGLVDMKESNVIFTEWTPAQRWNIYDYPTHARLINTRGVTFITPKDLEFDKDVVIGYCQKNHKSVVSSIEPKLNELVDIEMKKRTSRISQSQPWAFVFSPEDHKLVKKIQEAIDTDNPYLFLESLEPDKVKSVNSGAPYIVDKLEQDRQKVENDILTMLGVNNVGIGEKKEHLVVDEVNANNGMIEDSSDSYAREIQDFLTRIENALGYHITLEENSIPSDTDIMEGFTQDEKEDFEDE